MTEPSLPPVGIRIVHEYFGHGVIICYAGLLCFNDSIVVKFDDYSGEKTLVWWAAHRRIKYVTIKDLWQLYVSQI